MWELVLHAYLLDLNEPGVGPIRACTDEVLCKMMKDVVLKSGDHSEQAKLPQVEKGRELQGARDEEDKWLYGVFLCSFSRPSRVHL